MTPLRASSLSLATFAALSFGAAASAGMFFAEVDGIGGAGVIHAGPAPGVFGGGDPSDFSAPAVASLHTTLNDDGVQTDGRVTFLLLETDNGLSFATLVDRVELVDNPRGIPPEDLALAMVSTAPTSAPGRVFDNPNDLDPIFQSGGRNIASGDFFWASGLAFDGSAHAWTNLAQGDFVTYSFTERPETIGPNALSTDPTFQFATYDNESGTWSLLPSSGVTNDGNFTDLGQFAFSAEIVPAPGAALPMLGAGLAVLGRRRRR